MQHKPLLSAAFAALILLLRPASAQAQAQQSSPAAAEQAPAEAPSERDPSAQPQAPQPAPSDPGPAQTATPPAEASQVQAPPVAAPPEADAPSAAEVAQVQEPEAPQPQVKLSGAPGKGATVEVEDVFALNVRSRIQIRYQLDIPTADAAGERDLKQFMSIGTARLWFSGYAYTRDLTYMVQLALAGRDYRDGATSPIYDAFLDYKLHRDVSFRLGQYFVPFDRLRTVRESALQMADRPRPVVEMTLDRDVGFMAYSKTFLGDASPVAWYVGAFGGGGTNLSVGKTPGALVVGRVELRPLGTIDDDSEGDLERRPKPALAIGSAIAQNWNTNRTRSTTGTNYVGGTVDYFHAAVDLVFKWQGFALEAEHLWREGAPNEILSVDEDGAPVTEYSRSGRGWVLQASYVFDPPIEIVSRLSRLYANEDTDPAFINEVATSGQEVGGGLNYYLNGHSMKAQADWIARMPTDFDFSRASHVVHVQLDVTF